MSIIFFPSRPSPAMRQRAAPFRDRCIHRITGYLSISAIFHCSVCDHYTTLGSIACSDLQYRYSRSNTKVTCARCEHQHIIGTHNTVEKITDRNTECMKSAVGCRVYKFKPYYECWNCGELVDEDEEESRWAENYIGIEHLHVLRCWKWGYRNQADSSWTVKYVLETVICKPSPGGFKWMPMKAINGVDEEKRYVGKDGLIVDEIEVTDGVRDSFVEE